MIPAVWWARHQAFRLLQEVRDPRWQTLLSVAPDRAGMLSRFWPPDLGRMPQGKGDIGMRMARVFRQAPPGPVVIVGSDIPGIRRAHIACAFAELGRNRAVFGPAEDGGFWLAGLKRPPAPPAGLFLGVRWSTPFALADSLPTVHSDRIAFVSMLCDVDTSADLAQIDR